MKFLVDECVHPSIVKWLLLQGYDTMSIKMISAGIDDEQVLKKAFSEHRILITHDKGFGERIFKHQQNHAGIILLRIMHMKPEERILVLKNILDKHKNELHSSFIVATGDVIRVIPVTLH